MGDVTVGDITVVLADQQNGNMRLLVGSITDDAGDMTVGDVSVTVGNDSSFVLTLSLDATGSAGDITVGDITLNLQDEVTGGLGDVMIKGVATDGDITLGDIAISGTGYSDTVTFALTGMFSLAASVSGDVSLGDIDVSGVSNYIAGVDVNGNAAWITGTSADNVVIDTTSFASVGDITVGDTGFNVIVDDEYDGTITLGDGPDTVTIAAASTATRASDATASSMSIGDIGLSDVITFAGTGGLYSFNSTAVSFTAFTVAAVAYIDGVTTNTNETTDVYIGKVGSTYYAAVDSQNDDIVDDIVELDMTDAVAAYLDANTGFVVA
jgi:hypothetical protein